MRAEARKRAENSTSLSYSAKKLQREELPPEVPLEEAPEAPPVRALPVLETPLPPPMALERAVLSISSALRVVLFRMCSRSALGPLELPLVAAFPRPDAALPGPAVLEVALLDAFPDLIVRSMPGSGRVWVGSVSVDLCAAAVLLRNTQAVRAIMRRIRARSSGAFGGRWEGEAPGIGGLSDVCVSRYCDEPPPLAPPLAPPLDPPDMPDEPDWLGCCVDEPELPLWVPEVPELVERPPLELWLPPEFWSHPGRAMSAAAREPRISVRDNMEPPCCWGSKTPAAHAAGVKRTR
jgi:hypothetical protein